MTITITTSNVNGIRAAKRKGIEQWAAKNTPDVWCMQEAVSYTHLTLPTKLEV